MINGYVREQSVLFFLLSAMWDSPCILSVVLLWDSPISPFFVVVSVVGRDSSRMHFVKNVNLLEFACLYHTTVRIFLEYI